MGDERWLLRVSATSSAQREERVASDEDAASAALAIPMKSKAAHGVRLCASVRMRGRLSRLIGPNMAHPVQKASPPDAQTKKGPAVAGP